jgi:hypothetical protein
VRYQLTAADAANAAARVCIGPCSASAIAGLAFTLTRQTFDMPPAPVCDIGHQHVAKSNGVPWR